ncbi:MAG: DnaJ domain-containing protein, partial [Bdellovibrionota bacterium]
GGLASLEPRPDGPGSALAGLWGLPILAGAVLEGAKGQTASAQGVSQIESQLGPKFLAKTAEFFELAHLLPIEGDARGLLDAATGSKPFKMVLSHASDRAAWVRLAWALLLLGMLKPDGKAHEDAKAPFPIRPFKQTPPPAPPAPKPAVPMAPDRMEVMSVSEDPLAAAKPKSAAPQAFEKLDLDLEEDLGEVVEMIREVPGKAAAPAQPSGDRGLEEQLIDELDRVKKANYYQIFNSRPDRFNFQDVKKAYFDLQRKFSPDKFVMSAGDMMSKCEEFLDRISKAFETLSNIEKKQVYDAQLSKQKMLDQDKKSGGGLQASVAFESGRALIKEGDFASAEKEIRTAMRLAPGNVEHEVYLARAMYLNPKNKNDPANHIRARQMLDQCLIKNPRLAAGYAFRASIFLDQGKVDLAFGDLAKALKFDPNLLHAKNEMRRLEQLRQQQK